MKPLKKPAQPDIIRELKARIDLLLKNGMITKDFLVNSEEASAITGLSVETLRRYARFNHIDHYSYPGKNLYPCLSLCLWVEKHYQAATVSTSEMNNYQGVKMGRRKKKGVKV
ncbi:MAG: hypothetical protein LBH43_11150 [Treponema sp.]|jgi:hypothetical protein|nr:hypothetical protein [Treponema sp.]